MFSLKNLARKGLKVLSGVNEGNIFRVEIEEFPFNANPVSSIGVEPKLGPVNRIKRHILTPLFERY